MTKGRFPFPGVALALLAACGGGKNHLDYADDVSPIIESQCVVCHQPVGDLEPQGQLDLRGGWSAIVGVPAVESTAMSLVEPGDHLYSYLWHKLNGSQSIAGGSGTSMPLGGKISPEDFETLTNWIDQGAVDEH